MEGKGGKRKEGRKEDEEGKGGREIREEWKVRGGKGVDREKKKYSKRINKLK